MTQAFSLPWEWTFAPSALRWAGMTSERKQFPAEKEWQRNVKTSRSRPTDKMKARVRAAHSRQQYRLLGRRMNAAYRARAIRHHRARI